MSKDCSGSAATSVRGTTQSLHLPSLSSHFSHHFQSCKGFSYLFIPFCSFLWVIILVFCGEIIRHPTIMTVPPSLFYICPSKSWQNKPTIFSSNSFCRMGTQAFHITIAKMGVFLMLFHMGLRTEWHRAEVRERCTIT